ncbi:hypothetical protein K0M31_020259 [Melipona bicolor]|uniref:Uncharacterized protein n=1 Tax=Melipona bicolor TaxID=60889 RepID=A0AA40G145_9HYME|nr:hypothetical protein K0M31_020259 [Melipona bicolor]
MTVLPNQWAGHPPGLAGLEMVTKSFCRRVAALLAIGGSAVIEDVPSVTSDESDEGCAVYADSPFSQPCLLSPLTTRRDDA